MSMPGMLAAAEQRLAQLRQQSEHAYDAYYILEDCLEAHCCTRALKVLFAEGAAAFCQPAGKIRSIFLALLPMMLK